MRKTTKIYFIFPQKSDFLKNTKYFLSGVADDSRDFCTSKPVHNAAPSQICENPNLSALEI